MSNSNVKLLQQFLNLEGYIVSTTGAGSIGHENNYFGTKTKNALMKFQKVNKLKADGIFGANTRKVLKTITK